MKEDQLPFLRHSLTFLRLKSSLRLGAFARVLLRWVKLRWVKLKRESRKLK